MNSRCAIASVSLLAGAASADLPPLGGPMNHALVTLDATNTFRLSVERPGAQVLIEGPEQYDGPAHVLNGTRFNAQYGWLVSGLWAPPPGGYVEIRQTDATPGLSAYAGRAFGGLSFMQPICGTGGSGPAFLWDGVMLHNYYAASMPGLYWATYRVSIVDAAGEPVDGYTPGEITLSWAWETECPADLAEPFGVLDLSDITAFVSAFTGGVPGADLAEPFGVFDLGDLVAFVDGFTGGCP